MLHFDTLKPVVVKGREAPLNVFRAKHIHSTGTTGTKVLIASE